MDIKKEVSLEQKQTFWAEQLPNFEAKYWLPDHFSFLVFDMEQGNYVVKNDLDPIYEDDANEIYHRVNTGWAMWKKAINFSKSQVSEGFVLVPADQVKDTERLNFLLDDSRYVRTVVERDIEDEDYNKIGKHFMYAEVYWIDGWDYHESTSSNSMRGAIDKAMIEAQEQSHE
ncbi:hypothetical protein [Acinetobacter sp. ANC 4648]|uniref:hypothetical protein n=1 Tax=Acinetobacter sp. ANC 4648 TaxID=1977875 RepID=UPI000A340EFD|nr:hypothetical protein [Acinetobacter sp. ANC 4648]OTG82386.1 hypothetical protein B9T27_09125 [Acinetobacter sp. ANC 4648]